MNAGQAPFSPVALVGTIALLAAYALAGWCVAAGIAGNARKNRRLVTSSVYGLYGFGALIGLASALMIYAFVTHDFTIKYVAQTSDTSMPTAYKVTAFWGGLDGSLLFWVLVLSLFSVVAIAVNHKRHRDMIGFVVATIMVVQVFFLSLLIFTKNPFNTFLTMPPVDGKGLNPLLQNYWMVIHPPSLYTGFVAATIPFAFGIGALASNRLDDMWLGSVRVWMLICFGFLSLGLILGGRWAYEELGWGGYWAWDPVECAGLIPWFTATAFLHSAIIQEQRGMMKIWNLSLVVLTFFLTIFGTFMTRSGAVQSVHAFGEDNVLALQFIVFMAAILIVSIGLIVYRSNQLATRTQFDSFYSREFAFLLNNWILLACAFFVLFATMFPTMSEALVGDRKSVGIPFFNKWMTPFGLVLLFLAGAAPLLAWRKTTVERLKNQFVFPFAMMAVTVIGAIIFFPQTKHLSPIFADDFKLPISLINFGLIGFVMGSIGQEFFRGMMVRSRQTGSDPVTSMIGLVLSKRRKYGGYIVHLGVAVLFMGFAGKAYDHMVDRTIAKPGARAAQGGGPASFEYGGYEFVYERLIRTSDDNKTAITAQVGIYLDGDRIDTLYPAKWNFKKGEQQTTSEVAISTRGWPQQLDELGGGDIYLVLTGYDTDSGLGNFRIFVNPLILWVWIGFLIMAGGTLICLIPQRLVDAMQWKPRAKLGRVADTSIIIGVLLAGLLGLSRQANAAGGGAEHVEAGMGMGQQAKGYAAEYRPSRETVWAALQAAGWTTQTMPTAQVDAVAETAARAMKDLNCVCGGCTRLNIFDCDCGTASQLRKKIVELIAQTDNQGKPVFDLTTDDGRDQAYEAVVATFIAEYGGERVLVNPRSKVSWLFPSIAAVGALGVLLVAGRRWMGRGHATAAVTAAASAAATPSAAAKSTTVADDDDYADKLDDELSRTE